MYFVFIALPLLWLVICYISHNAGNMIFAIPGIIVTHAYLPVYSPLLITGGRKERFWSSVAIALADTLMITALVPAFAILTIFLKPIMPALTVSGEIIHFTALDIRLFSFVHRY